MTAKVFGMRLKALRIAREMSQEMLARKVGVSREYVARLEAGQHDPPLSTIEKLAKALKVNVAALLEKPMKGLCSNCEHSRDLNEDLYCTECADLVARADAKLERSDLPRVSVHEFGSEGRTENRPGATCALCDRVIEEKQHWFLPKVSNKKTGVRADLHFHEPCHRAWYKQALTE
jgi:transcriptional regulator with XRE-family HTH domain